MLISTITEPASRFFRPHSFTHGVYEGDGAYAGIVYLYLCDTWFYALRRKADDKVVWTKANADWIPPNVLRPSSLVITFKTE